MIIYYTHNAKPAGFTKRIYDRHKAQAERTGQRFVAIVAEQIGDGDIIQSFDDSQPPFTDIYLRIQRGLDFAQIDDFVYLNEDDVLYPDNRYYWELTDPRRVTYSLNIVYLCERGFFLLHPGAIALSQLMGSASAMSFNIAHKLEEARADQLRCFEPCCGPGKPYVSGTTRNISPSVDFRTAHNSSWKTPADVKCFQYLEGWGEASELWNEMYKGES